MRKRHQLALPPIAQQGPDDQPDYTGLVRNEWSHGVRAEMPPLHQLGHGVMLIMRDAGALKLHRSPPSASPQARRRPWPRVPKSTRPQPRL